MKDSPIVCPRCNVECVKREYTPVFRTVVLDECPKCRGQWFDHGELSKISRGRNIENFLDHFEGFEKVSEVSCPRCKGIMDVERVLDIEVDVCVKCKGIWLDSGEYNSIMHDDKKREVVDSCVQRGELPKYEDDADPEGQMNLQARRARDVMVAYRYLPRGQFSP